MSPRRIRSSAERLSLAGLLIAWLLAPTGVLAGQSWSIGADTSSVPVGISTTVRLTITNTSGNSGGGEGIGCTTVVVPAAFVVSAVSLVSVTSGWSWSASSSGSGPTTVTAQAADDGNRILGSPINDTLVVDVTVTGGVVGAYDWVADEYQDSDCSGDFNRTVNVPMAVVAAPNNAPTAVADAYVASANVPLIVNAGSGVLANDSDPDGDGLTASLLSGPSDGVLLLDANGSFTYSPNLLFTGTDVFTYLASDGLAFSGSATVTISVSNDPPTASDDTGAAWRNGSLSVGAPGVLGNDADPNGDGLAAVLQAGPSNGLLTLNADGSYDYTPDPGFTGTDAFTYMASDGSSSSGTATVTITTTNRAPTAGDDSAATSKDVALLVAAPGVLANDSDPDTDSLVVALASGPSNGLLTLNADGSWQYTPNSAFIGTDTFTYTVSDGIALSTPATVTIGVSNGAPIAADEGAAAWRNGSASMAIPGVLANDSDPDGDSLSAVLDSGPGNGSLSLNADGSWTYTPDPGWVGTDAFTYLADDGTTTSAPATVTITVSNRAPTAGHDSAGTPKNVALHVAAPGVLGSDADADGDSLAATVVGGVSNGSLTLNPDGSWDYTPDADFVGVDSFTYEAHDGLAASAVATVTINVTNTAPTASSDLAGAWRNGSVVVVAPGVLGNDTDADADPLTASLAAGPANGSLSLQPDGSFTYVPDPGFVGTDTFAYEASDGTATSAPALVTVTVANRPPTAASATYMVVGGSTLTVMAPGVLTGAADPDGDDLTAVLVTGPNHGELALSADGPFEYLPTAGFTGTDTFEFRVDDGVSTSAKASITINVSAPAATPRPSTPAPLPSPSGTPAQSPAPTPEPGPTAGATAAPSPTPAPSGPQPTAGPGPGGEAFVVDLGGGNGAAQIHVDGLSLAAALIASIGAFTWLVPGLALSVPGLIVLLTILAQATGGLLWLPLARRKIGTFGLRRISDGGPPSSRE